MKIYDANEYFTGKWIQNEMHTLNVFILLKVLYVGLTAELGIAVQIQNIGEVFLTRPLLLRLAHTSCQINDMNEIKYAVFSANWQPGVPKYNWVNWQWAGFTNHNKHRHSGPDRTFSKKDY